MRPTGVWRLSAAPCAPPTSDDVCVLYLEAEDRILQNAFLDPSDSSMEHLVVCITLANHKIAGPIIISNTVHMVNPCARRKGPAKCFLCHQNVFQNISMRV